MVDPTQEQYEYYGLGELIERENPYKLPQGAKLDLEHVRVSGKHKDKKKGRAIDGDPGPALPFAPPGDDGGSKPAVDRKYNIVKAIEIGYEGVPARQRRHIIILYAGDGI